MSRDDDEREEVQEPEEIDFHEYDLHGNYLGPRGLIVPLYRTDDQDKRDYAEWFAALENPPE